MHIEQVTEQLRTMRLSTMAETIGTRLRNGDDKGLTALEFVALLVEDEYTARKNRKMQRMIAQANFKPEMPSVEQLDYRASRGLPKSEVLQLTTPTWIDQADNIIITGPTGSGKTYLAEALGLQACRMGYPAAKIRYRILFEEIKAARGTGTYLKYLKKMTRLRVLIIDDFLMHMIDTQEASLLMDIVEERQQTGSIILTTQYPVAKWHQRLPDPTIADALCDRLVHAARKFNLKGDSMRKVSTKSGSK